MPLRLLKTHSVDLELVEFDDHAYPPYAILSHVWEKGQEIEYHELAQGQQLKHKHGWRKIAETKRIAREQGLDYIWIDTCCIDKSSSAELAEALHSMFAWYQKAKICYAYLEEVSDQSLFSLTNVGAVDISFPVKRLQTQESLQEGIDGHLKVDHQQTSKIDNNSRWKEFMQSRWFTRGWTLQELLAPSSLLFYDAAWNMIESFDTAVDDDRTLAHIVGEITRIDKDLLLRKRPMQSYSIAQKMSWAANRQTTRIEDRAYSLLGIFDISMAVIYGEGERAFRRLQEELMRTYTDPTIFAWQSQPEDITAAVPGIGKFLINYPRTDLLASSPKAFSQCNRMVPLSGPNQQQIFQVIGSIVRFQSRLYEDSDLRGTEQAVVLCRCEDSRTQVVLLRLRLSISNEAYFATSGNRLILLDIHAADLRSKPRTVNVWKNVGTQQHVETTALAEILVRAKSTPISAPRIEVLSGEPADKWNMELQAFELPASSTEFDGYIWISTSGYGAQSEESIQLSMRRGRMYASFQNSDLLETWVNLPFVLARNSLKHGHRGVLIVRASNRQLLGRAVNLIEIDMVHWWNAVLPFLELVIIPASISVVDFAQSMNDRLLEPFLLVLAEPSMMLSVWMEPIDYVIGVMIRSLIYYTPAIVLYILIIYSLGLAFT